MSFLKAGEPGRQSTGPIRLLDRSSRAFFARLRHLVKLVDDDLLSAEIRPVVFVEARRVLQVLFVQIQGEAIILLVKMQGLPWHRKIFIPDTGKSTEVQDRVLNITVLRVDDQIFDVSQIFSIRALDLCPDQIAGLEHAAAVARLARRTQGKGQDADERSHYHL